MAQKTTKTTDVFNAIKIQEPYHLLPHPKTNRLIDSHPGTRTLPMKLMVLGVSRTGTMSIFSALETLGYKPYHMAKALMAPKSNLDVWCEALAAKYSGRGKEFGREEFDKILGGYDAFADVPMIAFVEELVLAYPGAKVVLQSRDVDEWLRSMENTAGVVLKWSTWPWLVGWDGSLAEPFWRHACALMPNMYGTFNDFSPQSPAREKFFEHYERVRRVVPKDMLLEYRVQEGWGPLCEFLEVEVPEVEYPRVNDAKQFVFAHSVMWYLAAGKLVLKTSVVWMPVIAIGVTAWIGRLPKLW